MKTRIHIHRENIAGTAGKKHFIVTLPRDVQDVIGIKISLVGLKKSPSENHFEAGTLRLIRDGIVLFETALRNESTDADFVRNNFSPSILDSGFAPVSGSKQLFDPICFPGQYRALFCKYESRNAPSGLAYKIALYFLYTKKSKV